MKFFFIIFVLNVLVLCKSSCDVNDEITQLFWTIKIDGDYYNPDYQNEDGVYNTADLLHFFMYLRLRTKLKNALDSRFPELQCDIEEICSTKTYKINLNNNENMFCSFCELYFKIEHKKEYVFTIDLLELWVFFQRNLTIHSNELIKKNTSLYFNTR